MRLEKIKVENFRSIKSQVLEIDNYLCLVGSNGTGKSTLLNALNVFFRYNDATVVDLTKLSQEDFFQKDTDTPIRIELHFTDLSEEAQEEFQTYYRNNKLVVFAEAKWDDDLGYAEVLHFGQRSVMNDFTPFFKASDEGALVAELREIYSKIKKNYPELPDISTKKGMTSALRDFEESNPDKCILVRSNDQFYGFSRGSNKLSKYIQWVYIPAVKDASSEQEEGRSSALSTLLDRTIRSQLDFEDPLQELKNDVEQKYQQILDSKSDVLKGISGSLEARLKEWSHPGTKLDILWNYDPNRSISINSPTAKVSVGEGDFLGEIARSGHGLQRAFLISILQELAHSDQETSPLLLLGFEEPELYQHPPQARHIQRVLEDLSEKNSQIIVTTHSPYFVSSRGFESIRRFRKDPNDGKCIISQTNWDKVAQSLSEALEDEPILKSSLVGKVEQIMQPSQNELYFSTVAILVEGTEDIAYLTSHLILKEKWSEFRKHGCHFVACSGKTNLSRPLAIAKELQIPAFLIFDGDTDKKKEEQKKRNARDNSCLMRLCGYKEEEFDPLPDKNIWGEDVIVWKENLTNEIRNEFGTDKFSQEYNKMIVQKKLDGLSQKNSYGITVFMEHLYNEQGWESKILEKATNNILEFARTKQSNNN